MRYFLFLLVCGFGLFSGVARAQSLDSIKRFSDSELVETIGNGFLLSEELLRDFDAQIAEGKTVSNLLGEDTQYLYAKILLERALKEDLEREFERRIESGAIQGTHESLRSTGRILRRKMAQLANQTQLDPTVLGFAMKGVLEAADRQDRNLGTGFESSNSGPSLEALRNWREEFRLKGAHAPDSKSIRKIRKWMDRDARILADAIQPDREFVKYSEAQSKIFPSTTSSGNITGNGFEPGVWALTFDDGPGVTTDAVLDNLKKHSILASFFALSAQVKKSQQFRTLALKEAQEGHDVFSHSFDHPQVSKLGEFGRRYQIEGAIEVLASIMGARTDFFRLPYGAGVSVPTVRQDLVKSCVVHVFWNVDTLDWHDHDPDLIEKRALAQMKTLGRGIILFHDIHSQSVIASERIMRHLNENHLKTVRISDYVAEKNGNQKWQCTVNWPANPLR
jgi:peptidoglycan/xylan/chitin deacetylase (PgdA/CDA1 family)